MASTLLLVSHLLVLLAALASASHFYGGNNAFTSRENPNGTFTVVLRQRVAYDGPARPRWNCFRGVCGQPSVIGQGTLDSGTNGPSRSERWTESQTFLSTTVQTNKPFQLRDSGCCLVKRGWPWSLLTEVDLGIRSDTGKPNNSPDITILPFLRVPINCPRTYKLLATDPDGDSVSCRHGKVRNEECGRCTKRPNFPIDEGSCTFHYANSKRTGLRVFEMVVEDFPTKTILLSYKDGTESIRHPQRPGRRRRSVLPTSIFLPTWWQNPTTPGSPTGPQTIVPMTTTPLLPSGSQSIPPGPMMSAALLPSGSQSIPPGPVMTTPLLPTGSQSILPGPMMTTPLSPTGSQSISHGPMMTTPLAPSGTQGPMMTTPLLPTGSQSIPQGPMMTTPLAPSGSQGPMMTTPLVPSGSQGPMMTTPLAPSGSQGPMMTTPLVPSGSQSIPPGPMMTTPIVPTGTQGPMMTTPIVPTGTQGPMMTTPLIPTGTHLPSPFWLFTTTPRPIKTTTQVTITTGTTYPPPSSPPPSYPPPPPPPSPTSPLSRLPLHFIVQVDLPAPSCQEGEYIPRFVHPTPRDGESLHAEVNKESEITVKAQATHSRIYDMVFSGPLNVTKRRTTRRDEWVIRWTPVPEDVGQKFPLCFIVEAKATPIKGSLMFYQSELRCVVVEVGRRGVKANVICNETFMTVEVDKLSFEGLATHLRLNEQSDVSCSLQDQHNATHIIATIPLNGCGTQIEEDDDNLIFKNAIITVDDVTSIITRKHHLQADVSCQYAKRSNVTLSFTAHRSNVTVREKGFGTFTYQFEFFTSAIFAQMIDPSSYPLEYDVGDRIYLEILASSSVKNTELFVESCRAAPYDNPSYRPTYPIIENGCNVDPTVEILSPRHGKDFKMSMEAFKFIGMHDQVYISCSVILCEAGNSNTRCSQGCIGGTKPSKAGVQRRKRDTVIQTSTHYISQGPLRLRRAPEIPATSLNLNLNLVFIAGCLLAAVAMVCAVAIYKDRMSRVKYVHMPSTEN